ncbi:MAG: uracil-DNA glycosylase, partial [Sulfurimonas sp.]
KKENLVFILWGAPAGAKASLINAKKHLILKAPHPSPLSSYRGFFGSKPFSKTNDFLKERGLKPIEWCL